MTTEPGTPPSPLRPTPPIELTGTGAHLSTSAVEVPPAALAALQAACPSTVVLAERAEASRDWWPLAMHWALAGDAPQIAAIVCSPTTTDEVADAVLYFAGASSTALTGQSMVVSHGWFMQ